MKAPRNTHSQPERYNFGSTQQTTEQYQLQGQPSYPQSGTYGMIPQQPYVPTKCSCIICQYCAPHPGAPVDPNSGSYYCQHHHGQVMNWADSANFNHNCPSRQPHAAPPAPYYGTTPPYGQEGYQYPTQAVAGASREYYQDNTPPPGQQHYSGPAQSGYGQQYSPPPEPFSGGDSSNYAYYGSNQRSWSGVSIAERFYLSKLLIVRAVNEIKSTAQENPSRANAVLSSISWGLALALRNCSAWTGNANEGSLLFTHRLCYPTLQ